MFQSPPREGPVRSWLLLGAWIMVIFFAIPWARQILRFIDAHWGVSMLRWVALVIIVVSALLALWSVFRNLHRLPWDRLFWLLGLVGVFAYLALEKMKTPSEALHFVEYGLLGLLAFRALSHHLRDRLIYPCVLMVCLLIGTSDEIVQWLTPGRYWDVRDIFHNGVAALLAQVALAGGLRPAFIRPGPSPRSVRCFFGLSTAFLLLLGCCASNTPVAVDWYSDRVPFLAFLRHQDNPMSEYGYRHDDPDIGRFYSRYDQETLRAMDEKRAGDAGPVIAYYWESDSYTNFLRRYTPATDPFMHEAMVHMFRRNHYQGVSVKYRQDADSYARHITVAYRENQILERYFPLTLEFSGQPWPAGLAEEMRNFIRTDRRYKSEVSRHLITVVTEQQIWIIILSLLGLNILFLFTLGRTKPGNWIGLSRNRHEGTCAPGRA